jgi:hypothetical protein
MFKQPTDHLDNLMTAMTIIDAATRSLAASRYIQQRETLGRSESYAALSALKVISNNSGV